MNCFTFGKSARHTVSNGFAKKVDKKEALKILKEAESAGLVHKAFHHAASITCIFVSIVFGKTHFSWFYTKEAYLL